MKGTTFKRCSCRDTTGRRLGRSCPQLARPGGGWSRSHGQWHWQIEIPARAAEPFPVAVHRDLRTGADPCARRVAAPTCPLLS